jgi:CubicO group peptidase (beta-lactamase class C family)
MTRTRSSHLLALLLLATNACSERPDAATDAARTMATVEATRPATTGLDSALLALVAERGETLPRLRTLIVARHGRAELEQHYRGPGLDAPANVKSVSKSILSAIVGIAIADGHLDGVDQPVSPFFTRYIPAGADSGVQRITVGNLLTMQSGLQGTSGSNYGRWVTSPNWVRHAVTRPMESEPGTVRRYSTGNSHLLSAVLTQATGSSTWAYARERLAQPLGIALPRWPADPQGIYFGGNEMRVSPRSSSSCSWSSRILTAVLISAMCVNACGKLPRKSPVRGSICSL